MTVAERVKDLLMKIDYILAPERGDDEFYYDPDYRLWVFWQLMDRESKWLMENCLNITFHTVDFLEHINKNKDPQYCYNYNFLIHDFDPKQSQAMQYVFQDYSKSTDNSNFIYTVSEEAGVEHLKILVDNYYIKP